MLEVPSFADVVAAAKRIAPYAVRTPLVEAPALSAIRGGRVFLKLENLQRTGSFKFRGAVNRILMIPESERGRGVVAFSSGNHAQGVAAALAAYLAGKLEGESVALVISGGNADFASIAQAVADHPAP
jgi:threonine dehydratase